MKLKIFILSLVASQVFANTFDELKAVNAKYIKGYDRILHLEKDGGVLSDKKQEDVELADEKFQQASGEFRPLEQKMEQLTSRHSSIPAMIEGLKQELLQNEQQTRLSKEAAVADGLFESADQVNRDAILSRIQKLEKEKNTQTKHIEKIEAQIEALISGVDYQTALKKIDLGKSTLEKNRKAKAALQRNLAGEKADLAVAEKKQSEVGAEVTRLKSKVEDISTKDLPVAIERNKKDRKRYVDDKSKSDRLLRQKTQLEREIRNLRASKRRAERERSVVLSEIDDLERELSNIRRQIRALSGLYSDQRDLERSLSRANDRRRDLESQESRWSSALSTARSLAAHAQRAKRKAEGKRNSLRNSLSQAKARVAKLKQREQRLAAAVAKKSQVQSNLSRVNSNISAQVSRISSFNGQVSQAESVVSSAKSAKQGAKRALNQAENKLQRLQSKLSSLRSELSQARSALQAAKAGGDQAEIQAAKSKVNAVKAKISRVQSAVSSASSGVSSARSTLQAKQSALQAAKGSLRGVRQSLRQAKSKKQQLEGRRAKLQGRLNTIIQKEGRLANVRSKIPGAQSAVRTAVSHLRQAEGQLSSAISTLNSRRAEVVRTKRELDSVQRQLSQVRNEIWSLQNRLSNVNDEIARLERLKSRGESIERYDLPDAESRRDRIVARLNQVIRTLRQTRARHSRTSALYSDAKKHTGQSLIDLNRSQEYLTFLKDEKKKYSDALGVAEKVYATIDVKVTKAKKVVGDTKQKIDAIELQSSRLVAEIQAAEINIRVIQQEKIQPFETRIGEHSGQLTVFERKARKFRELWDVLKALFAQRDVKKEQLSQLEQESSVLVEQIAVLKPSYEESKAAKQLSQTKLEVKMADLQELLDQIENLPGQLQELELRNFELLNQLLSEL